jgi:hypothetical protein
MQQVLGDEAKASGFIKVAEILLAPYIQDAINNRYSATRAIGAMDAFKSKM